MDATRLRTLVDAALNAQAALDAAKANERAAVDSVRWARDLHLTECGNLRSALAAIEGGFVIYGDKVIRVGQDGEGVRLFAYTLVSITALAPPPDPLPEADPSIMRKATAAAVLAATGQPPNTVPNSSPASKSPPMSGGTVPPLKKK